MKGIDRIFMGLVGLLVLGAFFAAMVALFTRVIPADNKEPLMLLVGTLNTLAGMVVGYWYASSHGSRMKDETAAQVAMASK